MKETTFNFRVESKLKTDAAKRAKRQQKSLADYICQLIENDKTTRPDYLKSSNKVFDTICSCENVLQMETASAMLLQLEILFGENKALRHVYEIKVEQLKSVKSNG